MPQVSRNIPHGSDVAKNILNEIKHRVRFWESKIGDKVDTWRKSEEKVLAYMPETETMTKRKSLREQGVPDYVTIQIPYSFAVVMSALTYITSVFLGRAPVFQYNGRHGESQQQIQALEALVDYQLLNGYMQPVLYTWFYDSLKYGYGVVGVHWDERVEIFTENVDQPVLNMLGMPTGEVNTIPMSFPIRTYAGNRLFNVQPQDFIWDAKWPAREFHKGEFCGRRTVIGWNDAVRRYQKGFYINIERVQSTDREFTNRASGSDQLERAEVYSSTTLESDAYDGFKKQHPQAFGGYEMVIEIIPSEWQLSESEYPEKWVFTCTADYSVLLGASPLGAAHCSYPYSVIPLEPEGYGLTTRGMPDILDPVQGTIDWLINSHFYNTRAALNNKFVVDPSKVVMKDVLNPLPGGIVRLKPNGYGTDVKLAMVQMPVTDVTQQHLPNVGFMMQFGERIIGVNDQIMGMLETGGRKTATEVRTSTSMGVNRLKMLAEFMSTSGVEPVSKMMVQNSQQYYDMELKMRIAGDLMQGAGENFIMVTPDMIGGFYDFVPVDGTQPIDRFAQVNLWKELIQACLTVPAIGMQYDLAGIFQWVAQLAGLRNITRFRIQLAPDEQLMLQATMGNMIGMNAAGPGAKSKMNGAGPPSDTKQGYQQANAAGEQAPMTNGAMM